MKKLLITSLVIVLALAGFGCGGGGDGGGGGGGSAKVAPTIKNLSYSPTAVYVSTSPVVFSGTFDFSDPDGDVASATLTITDASGATISTQTKPMNPTALASGTIQGSVSATPSVSATYNLQVYATDASGLRSNVLSGQVRIAEFPWSSRSPSPTAREYAAVAVLGERLYLLGGQRTDTGMTPGPATAAVEIYDPTTDTWTVAPPMPTARMGLVSVVVGGKIYAIGGRVDGYSTSAVTTVEEFDPVSQVWTTKASMPTPRFFAAGGEMNGLILVVGGERETNILNTVEAYDPLTDSWSARSPLTVARGELAAVGVDGHVYAVGGYAGLQLRWVGTVEGFDPTTGTWSERTPLPTARANLALVEFNGKLLAAGGENISRACNLLDSFDLSSGLWSAKTASTVSFARAPAGVSNGKVYIFANGQTLQYDPGSELQ